MPRDLLSYWKLATAIANLDRGGLLRHSASNQYSRVKVGDTVWIVIVRSQRLSLLGRILVGRVTDAIGAAKALRTTDLWNARSHIIAKRGTALPIQEIPIAGLAGRLRFDSQGGNDLLVVKNRAINAQQLQTMRILTRDSAALLQKALERCEPCKRRKAAPRSESTKASGHPSRAVRADQTRASVFRALRKLQVAGRDSPDLIKGRYRDLDRTRIELNGLCYVLSECLFHLFPGVFSPYRISWGGGATHWFLRFADGTILDAIASDGRECCSMEEYAMSRRAAFFTKAPSKRARILLERAGLSLPA